MKGFKKLFIVSLLVLLSNCQDVTVTSNTTLSSGASAACWESTLQGKCNKQKKMFAKFKVSDQDSICALFEVKTDGCYFKTDAASVEKLNALKDETLKNLTIAVNKYVSERFIKIQARMIKAQESNSSKVNLSSVNLMSDVTQKSSILAKKIFVHSIRKAYEALGLKPADFSKVTTEATITTSTNVNTGNRFLAEAEIEALITLPTMDGILEIQDEIDNYDDADVEFQAESEQSLAIIIAEKEIENMMVDKTEVANVEKDKTTKLKLKMEDLKNRFTVNSSANVDLNTLKNDKDKLKTKTNSEAKKICEATLETNNQMCNGDSLCVDIALATCAKENRTKINAIANSNTTTNIQFSQIVEEAKKDQTKIAEMVKQSNTKLTSNASINNSKLQIKNEFDVLIKADEDIKKNFEKDKEEYENKKNTIVNEIKNTLKNDVKMPKELENLLSEQEKSSLVKNTIKDDAKASLVINQGKEISNQVNNNTLNKDLLEEQKKFEELLKDNKNTLTKEQQELLELAAKAEVKSNQSLTKEEQKAIEDSKKIAEGMLKDTKGVADLVKESIKNLPDLLKAGGNNQINSNLNVNVSGKTRVLQNLTTTNEVSTTNTNTSVNVESNTSITVESVPYSFTISSILGCTKEAASLNTFLDNILPLTLESSANADLTKEILRLLAIVRAMPYPKINRVSPKYEDLLCARNFSDRSKVKDALNEIEKSQSACFLKIDKDGVRTCNKTVIEKTNSSENERAKDSTVTIICNNGVCASLFEVGANISLYIKDEFSFDVFTAQRKIISKCLNNELSTDECCHTNGYNASQKEVAKARLLVDKTNTKQRKLCKNEKKEIRAFYKAFLTLSIPTESADFDEMVKNIFEGIDVSAKIKVKGRLLNSDQMYLSGSDSTTYSNSNSGLSSEKDTQFEVAGSTPSNKATYERSLETTMNVQAGMELTSSFSLYNGLSSIFMILLILLSL